MLIQGRNSMFRGDVYRQQQQASDVLGAATIDDYWDMDGDKVTV